MNAIELKCNECGKDYGKLSAPYPLNYYCSDKCLADNVEKNKPKPDA